MKVRLLAIATLCLLISLAQAAEKKEEGRYGATPLKGDYYVYGGTLGEMTPPTQKDWKISFMFTGQLAKDLFNQIGPDVKKEAACSSAADYRERRRGDLGCIYTKEDGYSCTFGLNVISGKGTYGSIC
ncbi:hypothetical protein SRABI118_04288 [Massilia sp. Bi118]|uniref:hypothetical protein n=1 Tax=Massilia sp. Bi118 TaxID=2822346 RepID=UPI001DE6C8AC|nr:hypothetical protein [Massilia sp. Bi118]CAH0297813.1 hypothetical protein SRABI118_04288 [Massilia sp. Bi118]